MCIKEINNLKEIYDKGEHFCEKESAIFYKQNK